MTEPRTVVYRGASRSEVERKYHADARAAVAGGYIPASEEWSTALGQEVLTVRYAFDPAQGDAVLSALGEAERDSRIAAMAPSVATPPPAAAPASQTVVMNAKLRARINYWVTQGYRVVSETDRSAQLGRPRRFNAAEFIAMPIYLLEYLAQRERTVHLAVDERGEVTETGSALERSAYRRAQDRGSGFRVAVVVGGFVLFIVLVLILQAVT